MKVLDLFSGIGGFSLGLERAGMETVAFCEIDPYCRKVLKKHWPDVPIHEDIWELDGFRYRGAVDVICGGFPCQPYSLAGERRGSADDRALWPQMLRVIREVGPRWVLGENVPGIIGMELDAVLSDLEGLGYACRPIVIPACAVDAWHRRDRVWILGHSHSQPAGTKYAETSWLSAFDAYSAGLGFREGRTGGVASHSERSADTKRTIVADASGRRCGGTESGKMEQQGGAETIGTSIASNAGGARLEGLGLGLGTEPEHTALGDPCRWPDEPSVARVVHGLPGRVDRVRSLGNAVVPQIPEIIGRAILAQVQE